MRVSGTTVEVMAAALREAGVGLLFGFPGGGSNLDLIAAAEDAGLRFVLAHSESAAGFMAATFGELSGRPGVCLATLGPGAANLVNPAAHAFLDRAPVLLVTDRHPADVQTAMLHQRIDHQALFAPVTKAQLTLDHRTVRGEVERALTIAATPIPGPVQIDLPADEAAQPADPGSPDLTAPNTPSPSVETEARAMLAAAERPVVLIGLAAADPASARAVQRFVEDGALPFLTTYKAKGVLPESHALAAGIFTGATIEREIVNQADLIITIGLDPVELIPRAWGYRQPVLSISPWPLPDQTQFRPSLALSGPLAETLPALGCPRSDGWDRDALAGILAVQRRRLSPPVDGLAPHRVVEIACQQAGSDAIVAVDAGAHMFPATSFWRAEAPRSFLISNGLATMGYAVPAGICAALLFPDRRVVVLTGDGGMLLTAAELSTAARLGVRLTIVVFDDRSLSLIKIKQRQGNDASTSFAPIDWPMLARSVGVAGFAASSDDEFGGAFAAALREDGPSLVAARIDPSGYGAVLATIRG